MKTSRTAERERGLLDRCYTPVRTPADLLYVSRHCRVHKLVMPTPKKNTSS